MKLSQVLKNSNQYSKATYDMKTRSDGRLPDKATKPATKADKRIHFDHIVDSGQYNLRHDHDHAKELAFDYKRLSKEKPAEATRLQSQTIRFLGPIYNQMGLKLVRK